MSRDIDVILTPTPDQYEQLTRDLEDLRKAGASSNTSAIVDAVRAAADRVRAEPVRSAS